MIYDTPRTQVSVSLTVLVVVYQAYKSINLRYPVPDILNEFRDGSRALHQLLAIMRPLVQTPDRLDSFQSHRTKSKTTTTHRT